jgi:hypothetical protein
MLALLKPHNKARLRDMDMEEEGVTGRAEEQNRTLARAGFRHSSSQPRSGGG